MTTYNFDREIDRKKTNSLKYDFAVERGRVVDVLPLWVRIWIFRRRSLCWMHCRMRFPMGFSVIAR